MSDIKNNSPELIKRIEKTLEQLRPYLKADNGDVSLIDITDDMVVRLKFLGACQSCSMSMMTLKAGIEDSIMKSAPEIKEVIAIN